MVIQYKSKTMSDLDSLTKSVLDFRDKRDWKQFHNPKDSAIALVSEAVEVLDELKWKKPQEIEEYLKSKKSKIGDELCDVLFWVLLMMHDLNIDINKQFKSKMDENNKKYPVEKVKGKHLKYTEYK